MFALHEPSHVYSPTLNVLAPHAFSSECTKHTCHKLAGSDGVFGVCALHEPLQAYVPVLTLLAPQKFGFDVFVQVCP